MSDSMQWRNATPSDQTVCVLQTFLNTYDCEVTMRVCMLCHDDLFEPEQKAEQKLYGRSTFTYGAELCIAFRHQPMPLICCTGSAFCSSPYEAEQNALSTLLHQQRRNALYRATDAPDSAQSKQNERLLAASGWRAKVHH